MRIGLDIMGGDFAPTETPQAIVEFCAQFPDASLYLFGTQEVLDTVPKQENINLIPCKDVISMHEHPTKALKEKKESSIGVGFHFLQENKIDAFISAGNTGAMLVGALHIVKPIDGVLRPSIPTIIPRSDGKLSALLDVGINADCKPEVLNQFAILGSAYANHMLGFPEPKVGLLNIGEEDSKGNILAKASFPLLKENAKINFIGNIEGRDILRPISDVIVTDGFTGNIILKFAESLYEIFAVEKGIQNEYIKKFDYEQYGGVPVLGVQKPVIIGHGISKTAAFVQMLKVAKTMIESDFCSKLAKDFDA